MNKATIYLVFLMGFSSVLSAQSTHDLWVKDYNTAYEKSKEENKPMLIFFTGSDWCGPCKLLVKSLFENSKFNEMVKEDLVLYEADFPKDRSLLTESQIINNNALAKKYNQRNAFPNITILSSEGKLVGSIYGYGGMNEPYFKLIEKAKKLRVLIVSIFSLIVCWSNAQEAVNARFQGLKIFVTNLNVAEEFYQNKLGFEVVAKNKNLIELKTNSWPIFLELAKDKSTAGYPNNTRTGLSFQTSKLLPRINELKEKGVIFYDSLLSRNGVGVGIPFKDPFGNVLNLIEVQIREVPLFAGLQIYNSGVTISNMEMAVEFYERLLGFEEWSRDYLPNALPLKHFDGSFAFMIHYKERLQKNPNLYGTNSQLIQILTVPDLELIRAKFRKENIEFKSEGQKIICQDPEGNYLEIINKHK